jgi:MFS family permease
MSPGDAELRRRSTVAFVTIASGAIGSAAAGWFADRIGKARVATGAMIVSGACCAVAGFVFRAPAPILFLFAIVWGVAVVADSAQLSALVAQYSSREHVGTALTMQTCMGFLLTMVSIRLLRWSRSRSAGSGCSSASCRARCSARGRCADCSRRSDSRVSTALAAGAMGFLLQPPR